MRQDELATPGVGRLDWDSDFFGFEVARLRASSPDQLAESIDQAVQRRVRLAYWECAPDDAALNRAAVELGGRLVDRKCTYVRALEAADATVPEAASGPRPRHNERDQLIDLALQSGELSRFRVDPEIPSGAWERLYRIWMERSLSGEIADEVLVERRDGQAVGMITLSIDGHVGVIGLFAVHASQRGLGVGGALLSRALSWFVAAGCCSASVVTQGDNEGARRIYQKGGYRLSQMSHFYHFWNLC